jgi:hypothetical protein
MILQCERNDTDNRGHAVCLMCNRPFWLDAAVLTARVDGELVGYLCPRSTCLNESGRIRFAAAINRYRADETEPGGGAKC